MLRKWDELPAFMRCEEVKPYYEILRKNKSVCSSKECLIWLVD